MFVEIMPLRKLPKSLDFFDYAVPQELTEQIKIGQLVKAPFRRQTLLGIVLKTKESSAFKNIRPFTSIVRDNPIVTAEQLSVAAFISHHYVVSLATVVKQMIPPILKKPRGKKPVKGIFDQEGVVGKDAVPLFQKILKANARAVFLKLLSHETKSSLYHRLIKEYTGRKSSIAIIFPEIVDIENFYRSLPRSLRSLVCIYHHQLSASERLSSYQRIMNGKAGLVLGTPLSVLLPFRRIKLLIIDQAESLNHKQYDQNPRFDDRTVGLAMTKIYRLKLLYVSPTLSAEIFYKTKKREIKLIEANEEIRTDVKKVFLGGSLHDLGVRSITQELKAALDRVLKDDGKAFLFINKKGMAPIVICQDCGKSLVCPKCLSSYTWHQQEGQSYLKCHHCQKVESKVLKCPYCAGTRLKAHGLGTEQVEKDLGVLFKNARIMRYEAGTKSIPDPKEFDILISTQAAFKKIDFHDIKLIGVVFLDNILNLPDYKSQEKTFQLLFRLLSLISDNPGSKMLIQSYSLANPAIKFFPRHADYFLREELTIRKEFGYPPYSRLIKLIGRHEVRSAGLAEASKLYQMLTMPAVKGIAVLPPVPAFIAREFGQYRHYLIIKVAPTTSEHSLKGLLTRVPDNWVIDVEPEALL